jgi:endonuclease YncB( thermonuclease family)
MVVETYKGNITIRLSEIDCPEKSQSYGNEANDFTTDLALGESVNAYVESTDQYGRIVAKVILPNDLDLNRELVTVGLAWWYEQYSDDLSIGDLEQEARENNLGLWQEANPIPPWDFRNN